MNKKIFFLILFVFLIFSCTKTDEKEIFGNRIQEGVVFYFEVNEKTPFEVSDFYYQQIKYLISYIDNFPLPDQINNPWVFAVLGFNPLNNTLQYIFVLEGINTDFPDFEKQEFEDITVLYDNTGREKAGYLIFDEKTYLYIGSSSKIYLEKIKENKNSFFNDDLQNSGIISNNNWVFFYIPGAVFDLLNMIPEEYIQQYKILNVFKEIEISNIFGRLSANDKLNFQLQVISDSHSIIINIDFNNWDPIEIHEKVINFY